MKRVQTRIQQRKKRIRCSSPPTTTTTTTATATRSLPHEIIRHILSFVKDPVTFARVRQVCTTWRDVCTEIIHKEAEQADRCALRKNWNQAADIYESLLHIVPRFVPALLGLWHMLEWKGQQYHRQQPLWQQVLHAGGRAHKEARKWLTGKHCQHAHGWFLLGLWLATVRKDWNNAIKFFHRAASLGHSGAQYDLGWCHEAGIGTAQRDLHEAVIWYTKAAASDFPPALNNLGFAYCNAYGVKKDITRGICLYERAAQLGDAAGQCNFALALHKGSDDRPPNAEQAVMWWRCAAEQNHREGLFQMGLRFVDGDGVGPCCVTAVGYLLLAAAQGHPEAKLALTHYFNGLSISFVIPS